MDKDLLIKNIVLFDGHCNLCNSSVQFILKHEKKQTLYFTSLQSPTGIALLKHYAIDTTQTDSIIFIQNNKVYTKSSAALQLSKHLKGLYPLAFIFILIPSFIRNLLYDYIARNRYKWFGRTESCMMPSETTKHRFL